MTENKQAFYKTKPFRFILYGILSFCFVWGYNEYFFDGNYLGNQSIFNTVLFLAGLLLMHTAGKITDKKIRLGSFVFGFFLSDILLMGHALYVKGSLAALCNSPAGILRFLISMAGFTTILSCVLMLVIRYLPRIPKCTAETQWKIYKYPLLSGILFFLSWLPAYLAYYPGVFAYDMDVQTREALGLTQMTKHHPPLHTIFWKLCLMFEEFSGLNALMIYSVCQMLLLATALAFLIRFMVLQKWNNYLILGAVAFFCINPAVTLFSFIPTKDVFFTVCLIFFTIELCTFGIKRKENSTNVFGNLSLIIFGVLCCLFRNNMVYALIPAILLMLVLYRKYWKTFLLWLTCILLGYGLINGPVYTLLGIGEGNVREMLSVPMQQISCVIIEHKEELSEADLAEAGRFLPVDSLNELYNPRLADPVKIHFNTGNFQADKAGFIELWLRLLIKYPLDYVDSFLNLNLPYWYPDANTNDEYSQRAYIETYIYPEESSGYKVTRDSKLPFLFNIYERCASYLLYDTMPLVANLFAISTPVWILILTMFLLVYQKKHTLILSILPAFFYWCTFLLGPVSNFRYVFPIIVLYPLYVAFLLQKDASKKE